MALGSKLLQWLKSQKDLPGKLGGLITENPGKAAGIGAAGLGAGSLAFNADDIITNLAMSSAERQTRDAIEDALGYAEEHPIATAVGLGSLAMGRDLLKPRPGIDVRLEDDRRRRR